MLKKVLLSSVLGGVVAFAWLSISWMALPYHKASVNAFNNEGAVAEVLKMSVSKPGIYYSKAGYDQAKKTKSATAEGQKADTTVSAEAPVIKNDATQTARPAIFVSYSQSKPGMMSQMLTSLAVHVLGAFFLSLMMLFLARSHLLARMSFGILFSLALAVLATAPLHVWWQFDLAFLALNLIDYFISWTLASMLIATIIKRPEVN